VVALDAPPAAAAAAAGDVITDDDNGVENMKSSLTGVVVMELSIPSEFSIFL
jgi:hypothetical protein